LMTKSKEGDQFLYILIATVLAAGAIIFMAGKTGGKLGLPVPMGSSSQAQTKATGEETPDNLMQQLQMTVDDGGEADLKLIEEEASGL
jgi:hypothetical protein